MAQQKTYTLSYVPFKGSPKSTKCLQVVKGRGFGPKRDHRGNFVDVNGKTIYKNEIQSFTLTLNK